MDILIELVASGTHDLEEVYPEKIRGEMLNHMSGTFKNNQHEISGKKPKPGREGFAHIDDPSRSVSDPHFHSAIVLSVGAKDRIVWISKDLFLVHMTLHQAFDQDSTLPLSPFGWDFPQ